MPVLPGPWNKEKHVFSALSQFLVVCAVLYRLVMATLAKGKRTKASIWCFLRYRSVANTFDSKQIIFETKRTH
jgi:hypothetical protein